MQVSGRRVGDARDVVALGAGARVGDFEVAGVIHKGNAGFVYVAIDHRSLTRIAVKEYLPTRLADRMADGHIGVRSLRHQTPFREGMQGFLRQARVLAELDEPALPRTLHLWQQHGTAYMAMPLCEGRTLEEVFRDSPRPSEPWLKTMLGPLLDALAALHQIECHPCDVTPHNVAVGDGGPLVFDVGIVRRILGRSSRGQVAVLAHGYAAIEQYSVDPSMPEGPWTDVYAVAAILHRAITGNPPPSPATRIDSDTLPPLGKMGGGYSESFLHAVNRGLAVRPQYRPQSIAEFREALGIRSLESFAVPTRAAQPVPCPAPPVETPEQRPAPTAEQRLAQTAGRALAGATETQGRAFAHVQELKPSLSLRAAEKVPLRMSSTIIGATLIVVVLAGLGLQRMLRREELPRAENHPAAIKTVSTSEQTSANTATPTLAVPMSSLPAPSLASIAPERTASAVAHAPATNVAAGTPKTGVTAPKTGKIQFAIKPWGEIVVDGRKRGVSPPIKELSLPEGRHRIEIRNSTFSGYTGKVDVKAGQSVSIAHSFTSP